MAANKYIASKLSLLSNRYNKRLVVPPIGLCTDNGAAIERLLKGEVGSLSFAPRSRWPIAN